MLAANLHRSFKSGSSVDRLLPLWLLGALVVCAHHWLPPRLTHGVLRGAYGAELLFGLVGFSSTFLALRARDSVVVGQLGSGEAARRVYLHMAVRTVPVYVVFLGVVLVATGASADTQLALWTGTYHLHAAMRGELTGTLAHMWAPSIAFWFCVLWVPCVTCMGRRMLLPVSVLLVVLGVGTRLVLASAGSPTVVLRCAGVTSLDALGTGAIACILVLRHGSRALLARPWTRAMLYLGVPWVAWGMYLQYDRHGSERALWETLVITLKAPLLFYLLVRGSVGFRGALGRFFTRGRGRAVAQGTLAVYLAHAFTPLVLARVVSMPLIPAGLLLLVLVTLAAGTVIHVAFECRFHPIAERYPLEVRAEVPARARRAA